MGRTNHRRTEIAPTMVRLSVSERQQLREKADAAGIKPLSAAIRTAISEWRPVPLERIAKFESGGTETLDG